MRRGLGSLSALDMPAGIDRGPSACASVDKSDPRYSQAVDRAFGYSRSDLAPIASRNSCRHDPRFRDFLGSCCRSGARMPQCPEHGPPLLRGEIGAVPQNALTVGDRSCVRQVTTIRAPSFPWLLLRPVASKACCAVANLSSRHTRRAAAVRAQGFSHGGNYPLWSPLFWTNYLDPQLALLAVQFCSPKDSIFRTQYGQPHLWS
jgi:hypothetical protein